MTDVFISYSRRDTEFARKLIDQLIRKGKDTWVDWEGIPLTSPNWWMEIQAGIEGADNFLYIMSPNSMASVVCNMELDYALEMKKRIIPVVYADVVSRDAFASIADFEPDEAMSQRLEGKDPLMIARNNWQNISHINWIFFRETDDFEPSFNQLVDVVETDLDYVKAHTRYLTRATEWERDNQREDLLLFGDEIDRAEAWLTKGIQYSEHSESGKKVDIVNPLPQELHQVYITRSRKAQHRRRRIVQLVTVAILVAIAVGVVAGLGAVSAINTSVTAVALANDAATSEALAVIAQQEAQEEANRIATSEAEAVDRIEAIETAVPATLDAVATLQDESYRFQMAGQASLNQGNENDALAFAFESISSVDPPLDALRSFYDTIGQSYNRATMTGQNSYFQDVAFSPDGKLIATTSFEETNLWDALTYEHIMTLTGQTGIIMSVAFSPNGEIIATGSYDKTIQLWDVDTGSPLSTLHGHSNIVRSIAFSPDGTILASAGCYDDAPLNDCIQGAIKLWDMETGEEIITLTEHSNTVYSIAFSPDGETLASASRDETIKLWDMENLTVLKTLRGHTNWVNDVVFNHSGNQLASASLDHTVKIWDVDSGEDILTLDSHTANVTHVIFSLDDKLIFSGSYDWTIKVWDTESGSELATLRAHQNHILGLAISPDGQTLASGSRDASLKLWDLQPVTIISKLENEDGVTLQQMALSSHNMLALRFDSKSIHIWDIDTRQHLLTVENTDSIMSMAFSPDGQTLAVGSTEGVITLWDLPTGDAVTTFRSSSYEARSVTFNPEGNILASASINHIITLWDVESGTELITLTGHTDYITDIAFSPTENTLAAGSIDDSIKLWDIESGIELITLTGHTNRIRSLAFSPDGLILASASNDKTVKLWDVASGDELENLVGHDDYVASVMFSPDGQWLASSGWEGAVKLWDVATGNELTTFIGHDQAVSKVVFSVDGNMLISANSDTTVSWNVMTLPLLRQWIQDNRYLREFTCEERNRFNMPVQCDDNENYPTRTPYPTSSPNPLPTWTPFWTPIPTATSTPVPTLAFTPFYENPNALANVHATGTALAED